MYGDIKEFENEPNLSIERACIIRDVYDSSGHKIGREKVVKNTKTECGVRKIPIYSLKSHFDRQKDFLVSKGYSISDDEPLFRNAKGGRYTQESLRDLFHKLANELNITPRGCYTLRHGFCSKLIQVTDIETTRDIAGQENITTTQGYLQTTETQKKNAMKNYAEKVYA